MSEAFQEEGLGVMVPRAGRGAAVRCMHKRDWRRPCSDSVCAPPVMNVLWRAGAESGKAFNGLLMR